VEEASHRQEPDSATSTIRSYLADVAFHVQKQSGPLPMLDRAVATGKSARIALDANNHVYRIVIPPPGEDMGHHVSVHCRVDCSKGLHYP